jgi:hypothetical protein
MLNAVPPENLILMTREWLYGIEAADGRVTDPGAAFYPVAIHAARAAVKHRSLAVRMVVLTVPAVPAFAFGVGCFIMTATTFPN